MRADGSAMGGRPDTPSRHATPRSRLHCAPMSARLVIVVGARPNFVKVAPGWHALAGVRNLTMHLLHTGQHYDAALSDRFLAELDLPAPDTFLGVGSGTHAEQTAGVMVGVERHLAAVRCDAVLVAGDVNSTMAAALAARKCQVPVIHLESGLRSGDWTMPEEVNRIVTDRIADLLLCTSEDARENLLAEGIADAGIVVVGNTMIDSLFRLLPGAAARSPLSRLGLEPRGFVLATLHRPALVDDPDELLPALDVLAEVAEIMPVVLPLHPRTRSRLNDLGVELAERVMGLDPLGYEEFIALEAQARLVITDSGGVQEETSALGVPCLTYRDTTERPITLRRGTNTLVGLDPDRLRSLTMAELDRSHADRVGSIPLWDGHAAARSADAISGFLLNRGVTGSVGRHATGAGMGIE